MYVYAVSWDYTQTQLNSFNMRKGGKKGKTKRRSRRKSGTNATPSLGVDLQFICHTRNTVDVVNLIVANLFSCGGSPTHAVPLAPTLVERV